MSELKWLACVGALAVFAWVFIESMRRDWETPALLFGFALLFGGCDLLQRLAP